MATAKTKILAEVGRRIGTSATLPKALLGTFALSIAGALTAMAIPAAGLPEIVPATTAVEALTLTPRAIEDNADRRFFREELIQRNDTLGSLLKRLGVNDALASEYLRTSPWARTIAQQTRPGKVVAAETDGSGVLLRLLLPLAQQDAFLVIERKADGSLDAEQQVIAGTRQVVVGSTVIRNSLFAATDEAGIPDGVAVQVAEIFGGEIDFHRDLQKGDRLLVVYEAIRQRGLPARAGRVLSAEFQQERRTLNAFFFETEGGGQGYYDAQGKNLRKAFLRSPLEFSRVTSRFSGSRFHPVLKEWRAHRGVDYGAPIGTRVRATADGQVAFVGRQGGYGNLILLKHGGSHTTAYGHLNGFAAGLKVGQRVQQGDVIGFVGRTGLASGPHLHYEFRVGDKQVNPLTVPLPEATPLSGSALATFMERKPEATHRLTMAGHGSQGVE